MARFDPHRYCLLSLLLWAALTEGLPGCKRPCSNRYGLRLCCDQVEKNSDPMCPPMPRMIVPCDSPRFKVKEIEVKACNDDTDCAKEEKCCKDICDPNASICMPSIRNTHYLMP